MRLPFTSPIYPVITLAQPLNKDKLQDNNILPELKGYLGRNISENDK